MGVINMTPDSFSDGGQYFRLDQVKRHANRLINEGADILDIGGESSRPGAQSISVAEELDRVIPIIEYIRNETEHCISIDTSKPGVMEAAVTAGANIINDISALRHPDALSMAFKLQVPVCLMHMLGNPATMQDSPGYINDVTEEVNLFFAQQIDRCLKAGIVRENLILDPGFGFGKTVQHNLKLVKHLGKFKQHNLPVLLGASRKSTLGVVLDKPVNERLIGGVSISVIALLQGAGIIRTHDVKETKQALIMTQAVMEADN